MKKGLTFAVLLFLVLLPISSVSAQKTRRINHTPKEQKMFVPTAQTEFGTTEAFSEGTGVYLNWRTIAEAKVLGFMVYRVSPGGREPVGRSIIPGSYLKTGQTTNEGNSYNFYDEKGDANSTYVIESLSDDGKTVVSAPFSTKQVTDLAAAAGTGAEELVEASGSKTETFETNEAKLPKALNNQKLAAESLSNIAMHRTVMAMPGVKIGVKKAGFYRVSRAELQAAGFDVNASPNQWQLFLEGEQIAINVAPNGDYIEFLGDGLDELESDTRVYNLIVGAGNGKRMGIEVSRPQGNGIAAASYFSTFTRKERTRYIPGLLNGDAQNYFGTLVFSSGGTVNFNLEDIDFEAGKSRLEIKLQGVGSTSHQIQVELNGETLDPISGNNYESMTGTYGLPISFFREGNNTLRLTEIPGAASLVDSIKVEIYRYYRARNNQLFSFTNPFRPSTVSNFTSPNIRVFNINNPLEPKLITNLEVVQEGSTYSVPLLSGPQKNIVAVEDTGVLAVSSVSPNAPSTLATPSHNADLVIISHGSFITQANAWADYRRGQGFNVEVVNVEDIYDEFGFCVNSSTSIRAFLQYAKNNWQTPPQYALLIGDSSYDRRNYQGFGSFNYIPSKFVDSIYTELPSDEALADFNDDGLSEIAVGRVPARTTPEVTNALNKTMAFELTSPQGFSRGAIFAFDRADGYDFEGLSHRLSDQLPSNMTKVFIHRDEPNAQTKVINETNNGRFLINYSGHGTAAAWATESFFGKSSVPLLTNSNNLTLYTMLTCLNGYFVEPSLTQESLSERLFSSTNGGAVATWSSTGLTTPDIQEVMATRYYSKITAGTIPRVGDLIRDAKSTINGGRDVRNSWGLLGDPTLKIR